MRVFGHGAMCDMATERLGMIPPVNVLGGGNDG